MATVVTRRAAVTWRSPAHDLIARAEQIGHSLRAINGAVQALPGEPRSGLWRARTPPHSCIAGPMEGSSGAMEATRPPPPATFPEPPRNYERAPMAPTQHPSTTIGHLPRTAEQVGRNSWSLNHLNQHPACPHRPTRETSTKHSHPGSPEHDGKATPANPPRVPEAKLARARSPTSHAQL